MLDACTVRARPLTRRARGLRVRPRLSRDRARCRPRRALGREECLCFDELQKLASGARTARRHAHRSLTQPSLKAHTHATLGLERVCSLEYGANRIASKCMPLQGRCTGWHVTSCEGATGRQRRCARPIANGEFSILPRLCNFTARKQRAEHICSSSSFNDPPLWSPVAQGCVWSRLARAIGTERGGRK